MRKIVFGVAILLGIAMVLPAMAVPLEPTIIMKVTGGGWYESYEGIKWTKAFNAQMDSFGTVKGQWQAQSPSPGPGTWHAEVTSVETGIFDSGLQVGNSVPVGQGFGSGVRSAWSAMSVWSSASVTSSMIVIS